VPGVFGFDGFRIWNVFRYLWEELLGVGLLLAVVGASRIFGEQRRLLLGLAAWTLPSVLLATVFRIEGQQDFWLESSWLPLYLLVAVGADRLLSPHGRGALPAAAAIGVAWAVVANGPSASMRGESLAEAFGRFHLEPLDRGAILVLESDDAFSTTRYLQVVRGLRPDVLVVEGARFRDGDWYPRHLQRRDPTLRTASTLVDFVLANERPAYFELPPEDPRLPTLPAGPLSRRAASGEPQDWLFPVRMEDVRARYGRPRGLRLRAGPAGLEVTPEPYEKRWVSAYVRARMQLGQHRFAAKQYERAAEAYEAARGADPEAPPAYAILRPLSASYFLTGRYDRAEPLLRQVLVLDPPPRVWVQSSYFLSQLCQAQGRAEEARRFREQAMAVAASDPELRRELETPR
jgi:hypothetical protein